jgi:hypothetical protein
LNFFLGKWKGSFSKSQIVIICIKFTMIDEKKWASTKKKQFFIKTHIFPLLTRGGEGVHPTVWLWPCSMCVPPSFPNHNSGLQQVALVGTATCYENVLGLSQ